MQALAAHSPPKRRRWTLVAAVVVLLAVGTGIGYLAARGGGATGGETRSRGGGRNATAASMGGQGGSRFSVVGTDPSPSASDVASNATITVRFSAPVTPSGPKPSLDPPVAGHWQRTAADTLTDDLSAPLVPSMAETLTVPGGSSGVRGADGQHLASSATVHFTVATGSTLRLQQLLAQLGYLPLAYTPPSPAPPPQDMAEPQPGSLTWRWSMPSTLTSLWFTGEPGVVTKGAVMMFEHQNGLTVDGLAGPKVWSALLADVAAGKGDTTPYTYVLVTKTLPEHLTVLVNGALQFSGVPVNTGAPGATTPDGTFEVFEHVKASDMRGTNVTGSTYTDPTVPWASYFHTGDALHGFQRAAYGFPQSNGCVEMPIATAGQIWPYTPIGTLVTVQGPTG
jgi:peptidoglycan hydrolase-like protein with peptidoglycan-binding domain